jgi:hypothetical protein
MNKQWYKSKTVWAAIVAGVLGVLQAIGLIVPEFVYVILGSFGLYGLRDAMKK